MSAPDNAADWLREIFGQDAPGFIILWEKTNKGTVAFPAGMVDAAGEAVREIGCAGEVYYGLGLQSQQPQGQGRGKGETVCALGGLWFDFDIAGEGHAQSDLPNSVEEVRSLISELPVPPTALIHTGGGLHVYWLLDALWRLENSSERKRAQALSATWQRMIVAKGKQRAWKLDTTSDLARVLRLPGTFNRKISTPRPVYVLEWNETRYSVAQLELASGQMPRSTSTLARDRQKPTSSRAKEAEAFRMLQCPWVAHCVADASTLPEPEWYGLLTLLAQCSDGQEMAQRWSEGHPNYSEADTLSKFRHAQDAPGPRTCRDIRDNLNGSAYCSQCKYGDRLTSPLLLTSAVYALAAEYAFVVDDVGFFHHKSRRRLSKEQFSDLHASTPVGKGSVASHVLKMPNLIRAAGYDYRPGSPTILIDGEEIKINLWIDDGIGPKDGDATPFLDHLAYLVPDEDARRHLLHWLAWTVQKPAQRVKHALILSGKQGTGKSYMARVLKLLHGPSNVHEVSVDELHGQFTGWLEGKQVVLIEELMAQGRLELANKLKPILTQEVIRINEKHKRVYQVRNLASFFCTTNFDDPIYIEEGDRRWWFYRSPAEPLAPDYYYELERWTVQNAGAIKAHLLSVDISEFNPNAAPPITKDKQRLIRASLPPVEWLLKERRDEGLFPFDRELVQLDYLFRVIREIHPSATIQQVARALTSMGGRKLSRTRVAGHQATIYAIRQPDFLVVQSPERIREEFQVDRQWPSLPSLTAETIGS
jgi:hypothetical protein